MKSVIILHFLLTRPYSWLYILCIAFLSRILTGFPLELDHFLMLDGVHALSLWFLSLFISETFQKDMEKRRIKPPVIIALMAIIAVLSIIRAPPTLLYFGLIVIVVYLYSLKSKDYKFSQFVFLSRGLLEVLICFIIFDFYTPFAEFSNELLFFALLIYALTTSRNIIGDIRDVNSDKYTFPVRFGTSISYYLSLIFLLFTLLIAIQSLSLNIFAVLPLLFLLPFYLFYRNAYILHKLFVISSTLFLFNIILSKSYVPITILIFIVVFSIILLLTYNLVPRKSNPKN